MIESMLILFRVDAGNLMGLGHLMRSLALARALAERGCHVLFLSNEPALDVLLKQGITVLQGESLACLHHADDALHLLHDNLQAISVEPDRLNDIQAVQKLLSGRTLSLIVADGYHFTPEYRKALSKLAPLMVIDDNNDNGMLSAQVVLNPSPQAHLLNYGKTAPGAVRLLGPTCCLTRSEFSRLALSTPESPAAFRQRKRLLVTFGGSDPLGLTIPVLQEIQTQFAHDTPITVITGPGHLDPKQVGHLASQLENCIHIHECDHMPEQMLSARLAISAAGSTQFELACCGTPALLAVVADNQRLATTELEKEGVCRSVCFIDADPGQEARRIVRIAKELWHQEKTLLAMHRAALRLNLGGGTEKVADWVHKWLKTGSKRGKSEL